MNESAIALTLFTPILIILGAAAGSLLLGGRLRPVAMGWLLGLAPLAAFGLMLANGGQLAADEPLIGRWAWLPSMGLTAVFHLDPLSLLFALLVTGIGTLVIIYTGYYFASDSGTARFFAYLLTFMAAMLGLVLAGDIITLFVFWEATSITSFLLVAYKYQYEEARRGAFQAFFITGGGGIALLLGLLLVSHAAGGSDWLTILNSGDAVRQSPLYLGMLGLLALAAFSKSAQFPFHFWLPDAMSAPTPASAYLHSATMVKAGIYLLARLNPVLGQTESWFWLLTVVGLVTMVLGATIGLRQHDLKGLLAYSTISQLGVLVMLLGQDTEIAFKALVIGVLAHALYKSALFLAVGMVDHAAGTRDLRRLGGLRVAMPLTFAVTLLAALSLAGLPPLFGFLAKETLLATAVHPSLPSLLGYLLTTAVVVAAAFKLVQATLVIADTFLGSPRDATIHAHEAPGLMVLLPAIPALLSLGLGVLPESKALAELLAGAAATAFGDKVKVSLALWAGLNIPLLLSLVAIAGGAVLAWYRQPLRLFLESNGARVTGRLLFDGLLRGLDGAANWVTGLQNGRLRRYLAVIIAATLLLIVRFGWGAVSLAGLRLTPFTFTVDGEWALLRLFALLIALTAALASVFLRRDLFAILAFTISGLGIALYMILEPAPDVALVQIVVDILSLVILVLALGRLPRAQRERAQRLNGLRQHGRDLLLAGGVGVVVTVVTLLALTTRPRFTAVSPFYLANAKPLAGAKDVVGAIIVDFRAFDTLIEIAVFSMAGLGVYTLLRYATRQFSNEAQRLVLPPNPLPTLGIGGATTSPLLRLLASVALPLALLIGATHVLYGHDQPGDGFTAGVIVSLAVAFSYVVYGYETTRQRLPWLRPLPLMGAGLLLVLAAGTVAAWLTGSFLGHVDFGKLWGLPLPAGVSFSTAFLFELAICLAVLGSVATMLNTLGHPLRLVVADEGEERVETAVSPSAGD